MTATATATATATTTTTTTTTTTSTEGAQDEEKIEEEKWMETNLDQRNPCRIMDEWIFQTNNPSFFPAMRSTDALTHSRAYFRCL